MNVQQAPYYPNNQVQYMNQPNQMAIGIPVNYTYSQPQVQIISALPPQQMIIMQQNLYKPPIHSTFYCNLITVIVFSCLNPWMCTSLSRASRGVVIVMMIIHLITSGLLIGGAAIGLGLNAKDPGLKSKRLMIFVFMIVGASWNVIAIIIWLSYLIILKRNGYDDDLFGPILYVVSVVLFCFDIGFKAPLIANCIIVAVRSWHVLGKEIGLAATIPQPTQQISQEQNNTQAISPAEYQSPIQNSKL